MTPLATTLILLSCGPAPRFEPWAPSTDRAVESPWGEPTNGVSTLFATHTDTLAVGDTFHVELFFRFSSVQSDGKVAAFADTMWELPRLVLTPRDGGTALVRSAFSPGGLGWLEDPSDHHDLRDGPFQSYGAQFHLLDRSGEQVPPGDYWATIEHRSAGTESRTYWNEEGEMESRPYAPGEVWTGTVTTGPMPIHIRPRGPERKVVELPHRIAFKHEVGQPGWDWDPASFEPDTLVVRPGFVVGFRTEYCTHYGRERMEQSVDATADPAELRRFVDTHDPGCGGSLSGIPSRDWPGWHYLPGPKDPEVVSEERPLEVRIAVTVFETSVPGESHWVPESGEYRVFREYEIRGFWQPPPSK
ncbi:MAG: hypothetical protein R3B81_14370 [bacterium]